MDTITTQARAALESMRPLVNADGADLEFIEIENGDTAVVRLRLEAVGCVDCVLPHEMLAAMLEDRLRTDVPGLTRLRLRDPRTEPGFQVAAH